LSYRVNDLVARFALSPLKLLSAGEFPSMRTSRSVAVCAIAIAASIVSVGCGDAKSPSPVAPTSPNQPTAPAQPTPALSSLSGLIQDTAFRGLPDARVEITEGSQAGAFTMTDHLGQFKMPGPFSGAVTVRASKEGYFPATQKIEGPPYSIGLRLKPTGPSADIIGEYSLTLVADSACTAFPDTARKRTYTLAIGPHPRSSLPLLYEGTLSGARFHPPTGFHFEIGVSGSIARFLIGEYGFGFVEDLGSGSLEIWGVVDAFVSRSSSSGSFVGAFTHCDGSLLGPGAVYWHCPVRPAHCEQANHRFTLTRR